MTVLARAVLGRVAEAAELLGAADHAARVRLGREAPYVSANVEMISGLRSCGLGEREWQPCYADGERWRIAEAVDRATFRGADTAA